PADGQLPVRRGQEEATGRGKIPAELIPSDKTARATIITRERAIICGLPWVDEVFRQLDPAIVIDWQVGDGDGVEPDQLLATLHGNARHLLTGERTALNFLQTLSGTATSAHDYAARVQGTEIKILD